MGSSKTGSSLLDKGGKHDLVYTSSVAIPGIVASTRAAFESGRTKPLSWRKAQLRAVRALVLENEAAITAAIAADLHRPQWESVVAELVAVAAEANDALSHLNSWAADESVPTPAALLPGTSALHREPLGVALIMSAWNFPFQLCLNPLIAAIAAGNTAVIKPSEISPVSSALLQALLEKYMDVDAVQVVQGGVGEATVLLEQKFDIICYTGNGAVARVVMAAAAKHLTPCLLELGGKSPTVVDSTADLTLAAKRIIANKCLNAGQVCIAPDYVLVEECVEAALTEKLKSSLAAFYGPDPQASASYSRMINRRHAERVAGYLKGSGGTIASGGKVDLDDLYIAPTLVSRPDESSALMRDEIFGPLLPIIPVPNVAAAVRFINAREKPLALYVFSSSSTNKDYILQNTSSGAVVENDCTLHNLSPELPFGGVGPSGMGCYHGRHGFLSFSHTRAIFRQDTILDVIGIMRYPPYTPFTVNLARSLMLGLSYLPPAPIGFKDTLILVLAAATAVLAAKVAGKY